MIIIGGESRGLVEKYPSIKHGPSLQERKDAGERPGDAGKTEGTK